MGRTVLAVGLGREINSLHSLLSRRDLRVENLPRGQSALVVAGAAAFDVVLVGHPLPDMALDVFLRELRETGSRCQQSDLLVVADAARVGEIAALVDAARGALSPREPPRRILDEVASRLLGIPPRVETRLLVKIEALLGTPANCILCQMVNLSTAGMLLRTDRLYPIGTRLSLEFGLPQDPKPIQGDVEVVRHAVVEIEGVDGVALKFVSLRGDGAARLQHFLSRQPRTAPPVGSRRV